MADRRVELALVGRHDGRLLDVVVNLAQGPGELFDFRGRILVAELLGHLLDLRHQPRDYRRQLFWQRTVG